MHAAPDSSNGVNLLLINFLRYEHISWPRSFRSGASQPQPRPPSATKPNPEVSLKIIAALTSVSSGGPNPQMRAGREQLVGKDL